MQKSWGIMSSGYITNGTTQDGFGARIHRAINTMAFTFYLRDKWNINLEYIHTPFSFEGFGENFSTGEKARGSTYINKYGDPYDEISREGYLRRAILWDNRLAYSGIKINDINLNEIKIINDLDFNKAELFGTLTTDQIVNKIYFVKYLHRELGRGDIDVNIINTYYSQIRSRFNFIVSNSENDVVMHIRRKDAINMPERYVDDEYYLQILQALSSRKGEYNITVHTQRQGFNFAKFLDWRVIYDDEEEDFDLFIKMVCAKVLVVGKSSLSIAAGFLNPNTVIYPPQPTIGLKRWINKEQFIKSLV